MRIIDPSFRIMDELMDMSVTTRIEQCGRLCYKSEDMITEESAPIFAKKVVKLGHNSVLEMAVFTLELTNVPFDEVHRFFESNTKYLFVDRLGGHKLLITGSVRSFREYCMFNDNEVKESIIRFLRSRHPIFYDDVSPGPYAPKINIRKVSVDELFKMDQSIIDKHYHVAVKFICNRAITHEIVRHRPVTYLQESQRYCRYDKDQFGNEVTFIKPMFFDEGSSEYTLWESSCKQAEHSYLQLLAQGATAQASRTVLPNSCKTEIIMYCNLVEWGHFLPIRNGKGVEPSMLQLTVPLWDEFTTRFPNSIAAKK